MGVGWEEVGGGGGVVVYGRGWGEVGGGGGWYAVTLTSTSCPCQKKWMANVDRPMGGGGENSESE